MTTNNKFYSVLAITVLLSACGSSSTSNETDESTQATKTAAKEQASDKNVTKLVATPVNAEEKLKGHAVEDMKEKIKDEFSGWQRGRVQFLNLEGGFYGIITDSGKKLLPMNMKKEFAQNGAIVRVKGKVKNVMTIQQWGTPFTITDIELISPGTIGNPADM